jgi:hypothetical protein
MVDLGDRPAHGPRSQDGAGPAQPTTQWTAYSCTLYMHTWRAHVAGTQYSYFGRHRDKLPDPDCNKGTVEVEIYRNSTGLASKSKSMTAGIDTAQTFTLQTTANRPTHARNYNCWKTPCQWKDHSF